MPNFVAARSIVGDRCSILQEHERLVHIREQHAVDEEARAVLDDDRRLANLFRQRHDRGDRLVTGFLAADDLDELHPVDRIEEVHADESFRMRGRLGHARDRDRRGVARQDRVVTHDFGEAAVDVFLERLVFGHGFDDHVAVSEGLGRRRGIERRQHVAQVLRRGAADLDPAHDDVRGALHAIGDPGLVDIDHGRTNSRPGVGRRDAGPHEAGAEHAHAFYGPRLY